MEIKEMLHLYATLCSTLANTEPRSLDTQITKFAFDTRRVNQNLEFNPRRNLQYYKRSEPYLNTQTADKIKLFYKIKGVVDELRHELENDPQWLDSYLRILGNTLDQVLRVDQHDMDYSKTQLDYLSELLFVRYRITDDDITRMSAPELRNMLLGKDEKLLYSSLHNSYGPLNKNSKVEAKVELKDTLMDKLFGEVKANRENKEVERSVTITIKDKILDDIVKTAVNRFYK